MMFHDVGIILGLHSVTQRRLMSGLHCTHNIGRRQQLFLLHSNIQSIEIVRTIESQIYCSHKQVVSIRVCCLMEVKLSTHDNKAYMYNMIYSH